jgi:hypothetical protein
LTTLLSQVLHFYHQTGANGMKITIYTSSQRGSKVTFDTTDERATYAAMLALEGHRVVKVYQTPACYVAPAAYRVPMPVFSMSTDGHFPQLLADGRPITVDDLNKLISER